MCVDVVNYNLQALSQKTHDIVHNYAMSVIQEADNLSDFVRQTMEEKGLTTRDVERKSGNSITHSYVNKIKNGDAKNLSTSTLQALAKGLDIPQEKIFAIVRGTPSNQILMIEELEMYLSELPESRQKDLLNIAKLFHSQQIAAMAVKRGDDIVLVKTKKMSKDKLSPMQETPASGELGKRKAQKKKVG